ncbi:hypothetical protein B0A52_08084 [Exophiala mesophila]|uniref:Uncharacterized protein n=1 Tax=Exophiala mesophila TaxID=212818 RepID=A0A438MZZ4_EXOME|nr:hypothetical protein B0A52_08084 [Exophiala mesophila]
MAPSNTHQQQQLLEMADSIPMTYGDDIFMVTSHAQNHFSHPIYEFDTVQPLQPVEPQFTEYNATPDSFSSSDLSTLPCLDYEILNGDSGLEDWVGADFQLFPTDLGYESYPGSLFLDNQGIDLSSSDDEANPKTKAARPTPPESACTVYNCSLSHALSLTVVNHSQKSEDLTAIFNPAMHASTKSSVDIAITAPRVRTQYRDISKQSMESKSASTVVCQLQPYLRFKDKCGISGKKSGESWFKLEELISFSWVLMK